MAETTRRYLPANQQLDITQILVEAQNRWLRPNEVCEILRNYKMFNLTPDPPYLPTGGSLFLFDRKALRYFRKDGHSWRKKKDGKTVREAHEKLKAGSVDVLHCYYAHGEDNENFQRRSYWLLDTQFENIVLVHYREVEGNRSGARRLLTPEVGKQSGSSQSFSAPRVHSSAPTGHTSYVSSPSTANFNGQTSCSELLEDVDSGEDLGTSKLAETSTCSRCPSVTSEAHERTGNSSSARNQLRTGIGGTCSILLSDPPLQSEYLDLRKNISGMQEQGITIEQPTQTVPVTRKLTDVKLEDCNLLKDGLDGESVAFSDTQVEALRRNSHRLFQGLSANEHSDLADLITSEDFPSGSGMTLGLKKTSAEVNYESGQLKKLDSFGRWMNNEIGVYCDDSLMASESGSFWNALDAQNDDNEVSSFSRHMQLDIDPLGPSLSQEQLFTICDFSPDWAYSGVVTKVLITGSFLGDSKRSKTIQWSCMFGEVEVPAELLTDNVLRCQAPVHAPGRFPFYVTCSNRLACSEVREFEFCEKPSSVLPLSVSNEPEDETRLQLRFARMLCLGMNRKWLDCSVKECEKCNLKDEILSTQIEEEKEWEMIEKSCLACDKNRENPRDALTKKLLKDKLYEWLVCSVHEEGKGPNILDDGGLGVIHLAAALGYEWALGPIIAAGVSPSFRDVHGRTGLHWASYYGREETVVALVRLGAAPGAVEDPTSKYPGGRTAADVASSRGHKGIAGYLAEADLTSHLSSLTLKGNGVATIAAETAVETVEEENAGRGQLSLKGSLAAVRKSAQAAALIQASFRARSFQYRQLTKTTEEVQDIPADLVTLASSSTKLRKVGHFSDHLHASALKIQQKYRGWKGRKEFLKIRNRIVKIQAHVRGHQVRKQYKKVVWSVSIVEKAILRWRRKGAGLRGFRAEKSLGDSQPPVGKTDEYDFLRQGRKQKVAGVEKALARVQSMVRYPEARDQYMRLATHFQKSKGLSANEHSDLADLITSEDFPSGSGMTLGLKKTSAEVNYESGQLKKLDSFGRWMNNEIGVYCDDSLMASESGSFWNALDAQNDDNEVSSFSRHMQLDIDPLGPSLSQEQLFTICDFSPDWAYSGVVTKVLITGSFLGDSKRSKTIQWSCMFGEVEVPAELLTDNVLRCQAPVHAPGRFPFYVTCSNRLACSEVREFEFCEKPSSVLPLSVSNEPEDETRLQLRFARMLCLGMNRKWLDCSVKECEKCNLKDEILSTQIEEEKEWEMIEKSCLACDKNRENPRDALTKKLLKDKLYEWLVCSVHEEGKGPNILDDGGLGVIHLAAALGYEWALGPIIAAGVSPSFRDVHGRTGLHWASYYGREETVVALVRLGAAPGAVEDPTSKYPGGRTAADVASSRGHKGIAGYLAEADLTSHLSSLTLKGNGVATIAAETAVETVEEENAGRGQLSLKGSLAAVRKSAQAAALIQASFRARSFQYRQLTKTTEEVQDIPADLVTLASSSTKLRKVGHFSDHLHASALKIQQKYRGWKGRKEFLKIRNRIVKIQAHVRGHQVRKQYKKVVWSVSIVEKAILRWRRKGAGLRGFRAEKSLGDSQPPVGKTDEYDFLRQGRKQKVAGVEKALARVQSMVRYPEARDQYMRLATHFQKSKMDGEGKCSSIQNQNSDQDLLKNTTQDEDLLAD